MTAARQGRIGSGKHPGFAPILDGHALKWGRWVTSADPPGAPSDAPPDAAKAQRRRGPANVGAFLVVFLFVWLVFDNLALALIFGIFAGGGSEAIQRKLD